MDLKVKYAHVLQKVVNGDQRFVPELQALAAELAAAEKKKADEPEKPKKESKEEPVK